MINKRFFSGILLTSYILGVGSVSPLLLSAPSSAQTQASDELYYTFFEQKIPLTLRSDAIAVAFKPVGRTRGTRSNKHDTLEGWPWQFRSMAQRPSIRVVIGSLSSKEERSRPQRSCKHA